MYNKWSNSPYSAADASTTSHTKYCVIDAASNRISKKLTLEYLTMEADSEVDLIVELFRDNTPTYLDSCLSPYSV